MFSPVKKSVSEPTLSSPILSIFRSRSPAKIACSPPPVVEVSNADLVAHKYGLLFSKTYSWHICLLDKYGPLDGKVIQPSDGSYYFMTVLSLDKHPQIFVLQTSIDPALFHAYLNQRPTTTNIVYVGKIFFEKDKYGSYQIESWQADFDAGYEWSPGLYEQAGLPCELYREGTPYDPLDIFESARPSPVKDIEDNLGNSSTPGLS